MNSELLALDGDGVLIDFHEGYARAWEKAFGERPSVGNPHGYHPADYWAVPRLDKAGVRHLYTKGFDEETWSTMPAMPGAKEACELLVRNGARLVCVTALEPHWAGARKRNLQALGLPVEEVYAVGHTQGVNPKAALLNQLKPAAFVDDLLPYLSGVAAPTWRALIEGRPDNSPNRLAGLPAPDSRHCDLRQFAVWWTTRAP